MPPHIGQGTGMAMEDAFLLCRLLQKHNDLSIVFEKYEGIRRPRIETLVKLSLQAGDMRRVASPWAQWFKEWSMWAWLRIMPETWLTRNMEYDITAVDIS